MKRTVFFACAICLFAACSQKENIAVESLSSPRVFEASTTSTRTYLDGLNVAWSAGDEISIFDETTDNLRYTYAGEAGATSGAFVAAAGSAAASGTAIDKVYASYPYDEYNVISDGAMLLWFLPAQIYKPGTFASETNIMAAQSDDTSLAFKNVCGYLKLRIYGDGSSAVKEIEVSGNGGESISGEGWVSFSETGEPVVEMVEDAYDLVYITLDPPVTLLADKPIDVWITLPPVEFKSGITVDVVSSENLTFSYTSTNPLEIKRGVCTATAPLEVVFPEVASAEEINEELAGYYTVSATSIWASDGFGPYSDDVISITAAPEGFDGNVYIEGSLIGGFPVAFYANYIDGTIYIPGGTVVYTGTVWENDDTIYDVSIYAIDGETIIFDDIPLILSGDHQLAFAYEGQYDLALLDNDYYALDILSSISFAYHNPSGSAKGVGVSNFKSRQQALVKGRALAPAGSSRRTALPRCPLR